MSALVFVLAARHVPCLTSEAGVLPAHQMAAILYHVLPNRIKMPLLPRRRRASSLGRMTGWEPTLLPTKRVVGAIV